VYQVGQLVGMLVKGDARERINTHHVRDLACSDHLKEIIHRCIGERRKRYVSADELIEALRHAPRRLRVGAQRSLKGVHIAFTGILSRTRKEAIRAGATGRRDRPMVRRRRSCGWWCAGGPIRCRPPDATAA
jgi:hypothetical protein